MIEEVEDVLYAAEEVVASPSSGRPIPFGETRTEKQSRSSSKLWTRTRWLSIRFGGQN